jgi:ABC-2 type transport system ATP-binding protein
VELELQRPEERFVAGLGEMGCEVAVREGGRMKLVLPADRSVRDLYELAQKYEVGIRLLNLMRDSLQDIFLRAMEDDHGGV